MYIMHGFSSVAVLWTVNAIISLHQSMLMFLISFCEDVQKVLSNIHWCNVTIETCFVVVYFSSFNTQISETKACYFTVT